MHAASEFRDVINRMDKDGNGIIDADELLSCAKDMVRNTQCRTRPMPFHAYVHRPHAGTLAHWQLALISQQAALFHHCI